MAIGIEGNAAFPQQHRPEIIACCRTGITATATRFDRFLAIMPLADDLSLPRCGQHVEAAFAHHRVEQFPAVIGFQLQQRFVDRRKGNLRRCRRFAIGLLDTDIDHRRLAHRIFFFVGLHFNAQHMPFPADLHLGDAQPVTRFGQVDECRRLAAFTIEKRQVPAPRKV